MSLRDTNSARPTWEHSSAGRAHALQAWGHRFEPCCSHHFGPVVQSVSTPACHAGGRRFESVPGRHFYSASVHSVCYAQDASVAQSVEQRTENPRVVGSIPTGGTRCGCSSSGRAPPCQGGGSEFEPRKPLQRGSLAQLGEHLPYKQRVTGSSPVTSTIWPGSSVG